jgi:hypothetical protein
LATGDDLLRLADSLALVLRRLVGRFDSGTEYC